MTPEQFAIKREEIIAARQNRNPLDDYSVIPTNPVERANYRLPYCPNGHLPTHYGYGINWQQWYCAHCDHFYRTHKFDSSHPANANIRWSR